jgi:hypothetical protein
MRCKIWASVMTRGVVLRQGPFFVFFANPRSRATSKSSHDLPGEATDCKAYETLIDLPELVPEALDTDAIRGDLKARGTKPIIPPEINPTRRSVPARNSTHAQSDRARIGHLKTNRVLATTAGGAEHHGG